MRDQKFYEQVKDLVIFKNLDGDYITLDEYLENNKEKHENRAFYVNDEPNSPSTFVCLKTMAWMQYTWIM